MMSIAAVIPTTQDMVMGSGIVFFCLMLQFRERWFLDETRKGQGLVRRFGPHRAPWILRGILLAGMTFGALLTGGVIHPIRW